MFGRYRVAALPFVAQLLDKLGYRRQGAEGLYRFVNSCGAPLGALNRSVRIFLRLTDYPKAVEVADEYVRRAPSDQSAHHLRAASYGSGVDGLLGMSFLSRFEVQMASGSIEIRTRQPRK